MATKPDETRDGVNLTNLDATLFEGAGATKRELVDYLDAVRDRIIPVLADRPLSVIRMMRGQDSFMQKNVPKVHARLGGDGHMVGGVVEARRPLRGVQRPAHVAVVRQPARHRVPPVAGDGGAPRSHSATLVLDLDPPRGFPTSRTSSRSRTSFDKRSTTWVWKARSRPAEPKACTSSCPSTPTRRRRTRRPPWRALAERTAALDPSIATTRVHQGRTRGQGVRRLDARRRRDGRRRVQPARASGCPVSFPLAWDQLDRVTPAEFTIHTAPDALADRDPWAEHMPAPQHLADDLIAEGHAIPVARVQAMHEGKRRKRARGE